MFNYLYYILPDHVLGQFPPPVDQKYSFSGCFRGPQVSKSTWIFRKSTCKYSKVLISTYPLKYPNFGPFLIFFRIFRLFARTKIKRNKALCVTKVPINTRLKMLRVPGSTRFCQILSKIAVIIRMCNICISLYQVKYCTRWRV